MRAAIAFYERGQDKYLRYTFAAMLGHEWQHAYLHEAGEVQPYTFELELLRDFFARGLMPSECILDIQHAERRLQEAQQANEKHQDPQVYIPLKTHP